MALQLLIPLLISPYLTSAGISCYGDKGQPVDWFIVYKLPNLNHSEEAGMKYMYQDGSSSGWVPGAYLMNSTDSAVGHTLTQLYNSKSQDVAYILYNDQPPIDPPNASRGHTKGVILLDKESGFWLVHSTPHFPYPSSLKYDWPSSAHHNGQSFICVTYPYQQFKDIGEQLLYNTITPYDASIPDSFEGDLPELRSAAEKKEVTAPPWNRLVTLTSAGGKKFLSFAKHADFGDASGPIEKHVVLALSCAAVPGTKLSQVGPLATDVFTPSSYPSAELINLQSGTQEIGKRLDRR